MIAASPRTNPIHTQYRQHRRNPKIWSSFCQAGRGGSLLLTSVHGTRLSVGHALYLWCGPLYNRRVEIRLNGNGRRILDRVPSANLFSAHPKETPAMPTLVVVGAQWGDEAKGKLVDVLGSQADMVVRYSGGNNAGHTVITGGQEFKFQLIPAGILHPGTVAVPWCAGMVICPKGLLEELDRTRAKLTPSLESS